MDREQRHVWRAKHAREQDCSQVWVCLACGVPQPCEVNVLLDAVVAVCHERDVALDTARLLRDQMSIVRDRISLAYDVAAIRK